MFVNPILLPPNAMLARYMLSSCVCLSIHHHHHYHFPRLTSDVVSSPSVNAFKSRLDNYWADYC